MKDLPVAVRVVGILVAGVIALTLAVRVVDRSFGGSRGGPGGSSYTTAETGVAAYADLLARNGHDIVRLRKKLSESTIPPTTTLVVFDGFLDPADHETVDAFVASGGRLVMSGPTNAQTTFVGDTVGRARTFVPTDDIANVEAVNSPRSGAFQPGGQGLPLIGNDRWDLLVSVEEGAGKRFLLASSSPLHNDQLDEVDNAALGLALAGPSSRKVIFAEDIHGYSDGAGLGALPGRARWVLALIGVAIAAWLFGRSRRLGPPESPDRETIPPRRQYVEAIASSLRKSGKRQEGVAGVQRAALRRLGSRTGVRLDDAPAELARAATRVGLSEAEFNAIVRPANTDKDVLAAGRVLAKLEARDR